MTTHTIFIAAPNNRRGKPDWLNANHKRHWAPKAELVRTWLLLAMHTARAVKLPQGLNKIRVTAYVHKTDNRSYDAHNLYPTVKAIIDGLTASRPKQPGYGLIPDDGNEHLKSVDIQQGEKRDQAGITLVIQDISDG